MACRRNNHEHWSTLHHLTEGGPCKPPPPPPFPQNIFYEHWGVICAEGETGSSIGSNIEQTRALVASLQTAVHFIKVLSESLAVVTQLLASSTMTDVQESITLLIYCHKFQVQVRVVHTSIDFYAVM